ncbi:hypothetical protein DFQ28_002638 [Apophysomyces sp. BC1034]|nr:hypothetical protein DFQ30_002922 [Apophysomyces sp. BC1015]KAG0179773.1 hypothetical protein DFQ29_001683 [Apophysomyces sp. BC1021]KAG0190004.1 hypothetical protein DFQ28_002638 [Apophysomyces sp. BC1034]
MGSDKHNESKKNLKWKIDYLAAQVGEDVRIGSAKEAAIAKLQYQKTWNVENTMDENELKHELEEARRQQFERKMFQVRRELRSSLKKSKALDIKKQIKRIHDARASLESIQKEGELEQIEPDATKESDKSKKKILTTEAVERLEREMEIAKAIDLDSLTEKTLRNKIMKHPTLKKIELITSIVNQTPSEESKTELDSRSAQLQSNVEARFLSQKVTKEEIAKILKEIETIAVGMQQQKAQNKKRKAEDQHDESQPKKIRASGESMFVESMLGSDSKDVQQKKTKSQAQNSSKTSADWEDPDFDKFYGTEKKNRAGQRQRRKKWEAMYGVKANHLGEEESRREQRKAVEIIKKKPKADMKEQFETMHPSWQAKRQQQEQIAMAMAMSGATANKKIVFDDDE